MKNDISESLSAKEIFTMAMELPDGPARESWLREQCRDDAALRQKVEELLAAAGEHDRASPLDAMVDAFAPGDTLQSSDVDGQAEASTLSMPEGLERRQIGSYKLLEQIGQGGFGTVYMAEQTVPVRRKVALKILKPGMDSSEVIARFEAERQALAMMDHPNIARIYDGGTTDTGRPYFVMELVRGIPVTAYCDEARLTTDERLTLFIDICRAVQHAHQKGIIHRDLKPSNVLVTMHDDKAVVKVIDFGIAKALSQQLTDRTLFTGYQQMLGTPLYMSPEQAQMSGIDIDTRSDVYSLGVMLYELLTGTTPFDKESLRKASFDDMRRIIREQEPPRPSARITTMQAEARSTVADRRRIDQRRVSDQLRGELDWIVMKALEKDRNRRYESVSTFVADVQRYLSDEPVLACPPTFIYRVSKYSKRHKGFLITALSIGLAVFLGAIVSIWQATEAIQARQLAEERLGTEQQARVQSDQHKQQSAENLRLALNAVDQMLMRVADERLAAIPGTEDIRRELLEQAVKFYEEFFKNPPEDPALQLSIAIAWKRVGELRQGLVMPAKAQAAREEAIRRLEKLHAAAPDDADIQSPLAEVCKEFAACEHWTLYRHASAEPVFLKAISHYQDLQRRFPEVAAYAWEETHVAISLADNYRITGRVELAEKTLRRLAQQQAQLMNPELDVEHHSVHLNYTCQAQNYLGSFLKQHGGEAGDIEDAYKSAVQYADEGMQLDPVHELWFVMSADGYGDFLVHRGRAPEAEQLLARAAVVGRQMAIKRPGYFHEINRYSAVLIKIGELQEHDERYSAAIANFRTAGELMRPAALAPERFGQWDGLSTKADNGVLRCLRLMIAGGERDEALRICEELSESDDSLAITLLSRMLAVMAWQVVNVPSRGQQLLEESIEVANSHHSMSSSECGKLGKGFFTWGDREYHRGRQDLALPLLDLSLKLAPENSEALDHRGRIHLNHGDNERAIADFNKSIECGAAYRLETIRSRACAHFRMGQFEAALADLAETSSRAAGDSNNLWAIDPMELAACPDQAFREAYLDWFQQAFLASSLRSDACAARAALFSALEQKDTSEQDLAAIAAESSASILAQHYAALVALRNGNEPLYREFSRLLATRAESALDATTFHRIVWPSVLSQNSLDDYSSLIATARRELTHAPVSSTALLDLGGILFRAGVYEESQTVLLNARAAASSEQASTVACDYLLGMTEHHLGNADAARVQLKIANEQSDKELAESVAWNRRLTIELLRKEAQVLIGDVAE
jgi:serine/threonine protein kinase/tetratricopeptide (TPR) repeat protein